MSLRVSPSGLVEIAAHEGIVPAPYLCSARVPTFGIGHTSAAGDPDPARMNPEFPSGDALERAIDYALDVFRGDLVRYEDRVKRAIKVPLKQHQFDALVSWDFNTGGALWRNPSTGRPAQLIQQINAGDYSGDGFMGWLRPPELRTRREHEVHLFRTGQYSSQRIPIWRTDGNLKLRGVIRSMPSEELLKRLGRPQEAPPSFLARLILRILERITQQ